MTIFVALRPLDSLGFFATLVPSEKRSTAFGVFDTVYGMAWFVGSATMGLLYDKSLPAIVFLSVALQSLALPVFIAARNKAT